VGAKRWADTRFARRLPDRRPETGWGMPGLVALVQRAAHRVAQRFPKSVLTVGDLSAREGGPLPGHHSHQSGRDVDLGFYTRNDRGRYVVPDKFVAFDGSGRASDRSGLAFDDRRNWALVQSLLTDGRTSVRAVFVASWLRARLLKHAASTGAPRELLVRAQTALLQPPNAEPHDDHFHVRIACVRSQLAFCHDDSVDLGPRPGPAPSAAPPAHGEEPGGAAPSGSAPPAPQPAPAGSAPPAPGMDEEP
jgi:penicillin-insensitive murein endopeptidase